MPPAIAPTMPRRSVAGSTRIVSTTAQSPHAGRAGAWATRGGAAIGGRGGGAAGTAAVAQGTAPRSSSKGSASVERATSPSSCRVAITRLSARSRSRAAIT